MMRNIYFFLILIISANVIYAQSEGDIVVIGYDSYTTSGSAGEADKFTLMVTKGSINSPSPVYITDKSYTNGDGGSVAAGFSTMNLTAEGTLRWDVPAGLERGDIIEFTITPGSPASVTVKVTDFGNPSANFPAGNVVVEEGWTDDANGANPLGQNGESLIIYTGALNAPTGFVYLFSTRSQESDGFLAMDANGNGTLDLEENASRTERPNDLDGSQGRNRGDFNFNSNTNAVSGASQGREFARVIVAPGTNIVDPSSDSQNNILDKVKEEDNWESADAASFDISANYFLNMLLATSELSKASNLNVYPNPTKGEVNFNLSSDVTIKSIEVMNTNGAVVKKGSENIDLSNLNSGIYFLKIQTSKGVELKKIIKQ